MAITYPIDFPNTRNPAAINWRGPRVDAFSQSPFTRNAKVYKHQGQWFEIDVTLPIMEREEAEEFIAFMLKLDGRSGTFLMGSPEAKQPRGAITDHLTYMVPNDRFDYGNLAGFVDQEDYGLVSTRATETDDDYGSVTVALLPLDPNGEEITNPPHTDGVTMRSNTIKLKDLPERVSKVLMAGDFIQIGSAATAKLYKILDTVNSDATGRATLTVWPKVIEPVANNSLVIVTNTRGVFRMASPVTEWNINDATLFGITFSAMQAL